MDRSNQLAIKLIMEGLFSKYWIFACMMVCITSCGHMQDRARPIPAWKRDFSFKPKDCIHSGQVWVLDKSGKIARRATTAERSLLDQILADGRQVTNFDGDAKASPPEPEAEYRVLSANGKN